MNNSKINMIPVTDWKFVSPQNPYVDTLTPSVMAFGGEAFGR